MTQDVDVITREEFEAMNPGKKVFTMQEMVAEFHETFGACTDPDLRIKLVEEEADELEEALGFVLKEACDLLYVAMGAQQEGVVLDEPLAARVQHLSNYLNIFHPQVLKEAFTRVHKSNMSKLDKDGRVVRREDGKVLKSDLYQPADVRSLI